VSISGSDTTTRENSKKGSVLVPYNLVQPIEQPLKDLTNKKKADLSFSFSKLR